MTTKIKITFGFGVMVILLIVMAVFGYNSLNTASNNFSDYRGLIQIDRATSQVQGELALMSYFAAQYLRTGDETFTEQATEQAKSAIEHMDLALSYMSEGPDKEEFKFTREQIAEFPEIIAAMKEHMEAAETHFTTVVAPVIQDFDKRLDSLAKTAEVSGNSELLGKLYTINYLLGEVRGAIQLYLQTKEPVYADAVRTHLAGVDTLLAEMNGLMNGATYREMMGIWDEVLKEFEPVYASGDLGNVAVEKLRSNREHALVETATASNAATDSAVQKGDESESSNERGQATLLAISVAGAILGVALGLFTIISLVRVLNALKRFSTDIANGEFGSTVHIKEKGEVGAMVAAMKQIPEVLEGVISETNDLSAKISTGHFRDRFNTEILKGDFAKMGISVNALADSYTRAIDLIPNPVLTSDNDFNYLFQNQAAQKLIGTNAVAYHCAPGSEECSGKSTFGSAAMKEDASKEGETQLTIGEKTIDATIMATPLHTVENTISGFMEIMTDVSTIRGQQRLMQEIANQASEISDRVAAASEELASQVEEVSRGADMQREQLESAASAMNEMNSTVIEVARNASSASQQSEEARKGADHGAGVVEQVVGAINEVNTIAEKLSDNMNELGEQADSISSVMNVISDIADQTNLLALNAAIEAARAGEAGRGFAVVADEVRKLAEKTMDATHEVESSITAIQSSSKINIEEVATAVESVRRATELANQSGDELGNIVDLVSDTSGAVASIATAAEEQSATSEEITRAVNEVNGLVRETVEGMTQSSAAVHDLARTAQELRQVMQSLR